MKDNLVSIKSFSNEVDAQIIQGKLKASGIKSFIVKDDCGGTDPLMQMAFGVELQVYQRDASNALKIVGTKNYKYTHTKKERRNNSFKNLSLFSLLMISIGIGLLVSGFIYHKQLLFYGILFMSFGLIIWCITKFMKINPTKIT
jgi:hypothetical protein